MSKQNVIGFWSEKNKYGFMSQWYPSKFTVDGNKFTSCEQWMMYQKAVLFKDIDDAKLILKMKDPKEIKKMGRKIKNFNEKLWDKNKFDIIYHGNLEKFTQDNELKEQLLATENKILAEASPYDKIYGIGMYPNDPDVQYPKRWKGENLLGQAIMKVREKISEQKN